MVLIGTALPVLVGPLAEQDRRPGATSASLLKPAVEANQGANYALLAVDPAVAAALMPLVILASGLLAAFGGAVAGKSAIRRLVLQDRSAGRSTRCSASG